ncbi:hypothetical protein ACSBPH_13675 [Microbacterium sp. F51-2R]|uniref:hypothetical protein n=1 Tax=Microbacterium sp. F51-2R TaxID=3445777 RepID=UPI003FA01C23
MGDEVGDVGIDEIRYGSATLAEKLRTRGVALVVCVFRHPVKVLLGSEGAPGMQTRQTSWARVSFGCPVRTTSARTLSA